MEPPGQGQRAPRIHGLDAARAVAVMAMVFGHTAEALLSLSVRASPAIQTYWIFRGLTAPLFLFVSGWAVVTAISRSGATGAALFRARVPRVLLLLALGMALRWPGWGLDRLFGFDRQVWAHFLGFDALQCIGLSLLLCAGALALVDRPASRLAVMVGLAVGLPVLGILLHGNAVMAALPQPLHAMLVTSRTSPFPVLPWSGYFFAGASAGLMLPLLKKSAHRGFALLLAGGALVAAMHPGWKPTLPIVDPVMFVHRLGQILILCAAAATIPAALARRLQPVGRSTLVLYVFHIPIIYGWSTFQGLGKRWGRVLELWQVALVAAVLVCAGLALAWGIRRGRALIEGLLARPVVPPPG
jgi:acyltransferase